MNNISDYEKQFDDILDGTVTKSPYDNDDYINYVKLNHARMKRWSKKGKIIPEFEKVLNNENVPTQWLIITEPWCGDAAHSYPFLVKLAELNPSIQITIQNRDAAGSEIDRYLTNGGKSIPKLIVRDKEGKDLFTWGPRPKGAVDFMKNNAAYQAMSPDEKKAALQKWYNKDKGSEIQAELLELLKGVMKVF